MSTDDDVMMSKMVMVMVMVVMMMMMVMSFCIVSAVESLMCFKRTTSSVVQSILFGNCHCGFMLR